MSGYVLELLAMLLVILVAAELFTNALEHLGARLNISEGVTGSLFAAVGTALPETMVPLLAVFGASGDAAVNEEIGVGSILGAPLMLSTLSTGLMAFAVLGSRGLRGRISPEPAGLNRDLHFFIFAFLVAAAAMYVPHTQRLPRLGLSLLLVATYVAYIYLTMRASKDLVMEGHGTSAEERMFASRAGLPTNYFTIFGQLGVGLALLVFGAEGFIAGVQGVSQLLHISALLLSLLIIPIATELPEKVNSILWVRRGKDTLAFGNITGAMVFQGTLLPAIGILLTPWQPRIEVLSGVAVTLIAALWIRVSVRAQGVAVWALLLNAALYGAYLFVTLAR
jgi:cation:H+ antiporter